MRVAVRAVIVQDGKLLLVNAWPGQQSDLWCAPGGGVEDHASLPDNLAREVYEELGVTIEVGAPCLVNEFHDPERDFHQIDLFFRCEIVAGQTSKDWRDTEGVVNRFCWVTADEARGLSLRPKTLVDVAFSDQASVYDPLEPILR